MPGTTPNRNYPYPIDTDNLDVADDIETLARAVDTDAESLDTAIAVETAARVNADTSILNGIAHGNIRGEGRASGLLIQGSYAEVLLNAEYAAAVVTFPEVFSARPVVVALPSHSPTNTILGVDEYTVKVDEFVIYGKHGDTGAPAYDTNTAFLWIAVGYRT